MKTSQKVFAVIVLVSLLIGLSGHFLLQHTQSILKDRIGGEVYTLVQNTMESVDRMIFLRIEEVQVLAHGLSMVEKSRASNREFEKLADPQAHIERIDRDWIQGRDTPEIRGILNNSLSRAFEQKRRFLQNKYGVDVFSEIFATNRFGALIAASPRTSDYNQADEDWYQQALETEDVWIEDIHYDTSTDSYALTAVTHLRDEQGAFLGLIKAGINIENVREVLDEFQAGSTLQSLRYYLVDETGAVIMSSLDPELRRLGRRERIKPFGTDLSDWTPVARSLEGKNGFIFTEEDERASLVAHVRSRGFKNFDGLDWSLVIEVAGEEVLGPVADLRAGMGGIWGLTLLLALGVGGVFVYSMVKPVEQLTRATRDISRGKWDVEVEVNGETPVEVGQLSDAFKNMALSLQGQLEQLEAQVTTKTRELVEARRIAEEASRAKSLFLSNMSHEIRTPLNAVLGYAQVLEKDPKLAPGQKAKLQSIYRSGTNLLHLINDIMDISRIEAGKQQVHNHDFDLNDLIGELEEHFAVLCRERGLEWVIDGIARDQSLPVHGDEQKIRQILSNLLDNAVKFTESGKVELRVKPQKDDRYLFEVLDTGSGIAEEKQQHIFNIFEQADLGVRKGGTGLGLAICKRLVELMGGELHLVSETDRFSHFYFTLTLPPAEAPPKIENRDLKQAVGLAQGCHVKVVVVDDDETHLEIVKEMLKRMGMEIETADSAAQGLARIRESLPDILLVDYRMPEMDGLSMVREVRRQYGPRRLKIIMLSASAFEHQKEEFFQNGVDAFLGKPLVREELLDTIRRLLNVDYVYASPDNGNTIEAIPEDPIDYGKVSAPPVLLERLKDHARKGLFKEFEERLGELERCGSEEKKLAEKLRALARQYDKPSILDELERSGSGG